jgi:heterodisulfide reductase subunit A
MNELLDTTSEDTGGSRRLRALVIGGGIAGIQAALDLANARIPVTVVEKGPALGGRMAQLDKTFPTMDCAI